MKKRILAAMLLLAMTFAFTGCSGGSGEPKEVLPPFEDEEWGQTVYPVGNTASIGDFEITLNEVYTTGTVSTYASEDDTTFVVWEMNVTNNGSEADYLVSAMRMNGLFCSILPAGSNDAYGHSSLMGYNKDVSGTSIEPGETAKDHVLVFEVPDEALSEDIEYWDLVFYFDGMSTTSNYPDDILVFRDI